MWRVLRVGWSLSCVCSPLKRHGHFVRHQEQGIQRTWYQYRYITGVITCIFMCFVFLPACVCPCDIGMSYRTYATGVLNCPYSVPGIMSALATTCTPTSRSFPFDSVLYKGWAVAYPPPLEKYRIEHRMTNHTPLGLISKPIFSKTIGAKGASLDVCGFHRCRKSPTGNSSEGVCVCSFVLPDIYQATRYITRWVPGTRCTV